MLYGCFYLYISLIAAKYSMFYVYHDYYMQHLPFFLHEEINNLIIFEIKVCLLKAANELQIAKRDQLPIRCSLKAIGLHSTRQQIVESRFQWKSYGLS
jgi:hypothetical protein